jgi:hypothetical protein
VGALAYCDIAHRMEAYHKSVGRVRKTRRRLSEHRSMGLHLLAASPGTVKRATNVAGILEMNAKIKKIHDD